MSDYVVLKDSSGPDAMLVGSGPPGVKGDPGGNVMAIGLFSAGSGQTIPAGTDVVRTSGHSAAAEGAAYYIHDAAVDSAYVAAHPTTSFRDLAGRGFRLSLEQPLNIKMFGLLLSNTGTANSSALNAMKAYLKATSELSGAYGSLPRVSLGVYGDFPISETFEIDAGAMHLTADVLPSPTTGAGLRAPAGVTAIRIQRYNTSGATGSTGTGTGGDGSIVERLRLTGGYTTVEGEVHAIHNRAHGVKARDNYIAGFEGDGIKNDSTGTNSNCNSCEASGNVVSNCRDGITFEGLNANGGSTKDNDVSGNRRWGLSDRSALGNSHEHDLAENCGICPGTHTPCAVSYSSNRYACVYGQEVGASTNAPSGTTADNAWWYYIGPGAPDTTDQNIPLWTSGITVRAGGPYQSTNNNAQCKFDGCYSEIGQGPSQFVWPTLVIGARQFAGIKGVSRLRHDPNGLRVDGTFGFGPYGADPDFLYSAAVLTARVGAKLQYQDAVSPTSDWFQFNGSGNFLTYTDQNVAGYFYSASSPTFFFDSGGIKAGGDNAKTLGGPSNRFSTVYAGTGTINTSDERHKAAIAAVDDAALDAWAEVEWLQFQYQDAVALKGTDGARIHAGLVAQRVQAAFEKHGIDPFRYGILCHDRWDDQLEPEIVTIEREVVSHHEKKTVRRWLRKVTVEVPVVMTAKVPQVRVGDDGKAVMKLVKPAGDIFGVRHDEAQALEAALQRRTSARIEERLTALEGRVS